MKKLHVTHSDLDGFGNLVLNYYFKEKFDLELSMNYSDFDREDFDYNIFKNFDEVIFTDFSPNQKALDIMIENNIKLTVIDHHESFYNLYLENKSKLESLNTNNIEIVFDNKKSGTKLYYEYLVRKHNKSRIPKIVNDIVELVDTYDLFKTDSEIWESALSLNRLLWTNYNWMFKDDLTTRKFSKILKLITTKIDTLSSFEFNIYEKNSINSTRDRELDTYKKTISNMLLRTDSKGFKFGVVRMKSQVSITCNTILKNYPKIDYLLVINEYDKNDLKLSGRSREFNLLKLNYLRGHKQASGSEPLESEFLEKLWLGKEFYELGYKDIEVEEEDIVLESFIRIY